MRVQGVRVALFLMLLAVFFVPGMKDAAFAQNVFDLDSDEFPIGVYMADPFSDKILEELKDAGITYVHSYTPGIDEEKNMALGQKYLDQAEKHGLKMMFMLKAKVYVNKDPEGVEHILNVVRRFKDHPALGFWYLYDEPQKPQIGKLDEYYQAIKKETPNIPIAIAHNWSKCWQEFYSAMDVHMIDNYPVRDETFPEAPLQTFTNFLEDALETGSRPVMPIAQLYSYKRKREKVRMLREGYDYDKLRYPNRQEMRYFMYGSLAMGARGLFFYSYCYPNKENRPFLENEFLPEMKEFSEFVKVVRPAHRPVVFKRAGDANLIAAYWARGEDSWLVLVNAWPLKRKLHRWTEDIVREAELIPAYGTRDAKAVISGGAIKVEAEPWECFVWKVKAAK